MSVVLAKLFACLLRSKIAPHAEKLQQQLEKLLQREMKRKCESRLADSSQVGPLPVLKVIEK